MQVKDETVEVNKQHADILWIYDMREELGIFPHNVSSCSPLVVGDLGRFPLEPAPLSDVFSAFRAGVVGVVVDLFPAHLAFVQPHSTTP